MNTTTLHRRKVEPIYPKLARMIIKRREEIGLTQEGLAKKSHISRSYLAAMETGRQRIYLHHLLKLEKALEYPLLLKFIRKAC
jgi:transcriptional regulator with XRE-family HTH domain